MLKAAKAGPAGAPNAKFHWHRFRNLGLYKIQEAQSHISSAVRSNSRVPFDGHAEAHSENDAAH